MPDRVDWPTQTGYQPAHEENQGRQALVAIFSDGERLAQRLANPLYQATTERLLRTLGLWPRLCFVDCSPTGRQLEPLLAPYGLETIALDAVPRWLGGLEQPPRNLPLGDGLHGGAQVWAAAMAIGGRQAQVHHAHNLRVQLGLPVSPWRGEQVLDAATQRPYSLINWFLRCEPRVGGGRLTPGGLVWRALAWWQQSYATAAQQMQAQENPLLPWRDSLASQRWQLEQALLRLYTDPENASRELAQLATESFEPEVRSRLSEFAAADHRAAQGETDQTYVYLTWSYDDLPVSTRHRLRRLGFANALYDEAPKPLAIPGRLALMASVLTALALTAFGVATYRWQTPDVPRFVSTDSFGNHPALARQTLRLVDHSSRGQYQVMLGSSRQQVGQMATLTSVPEGSVIPVTWQWERIASAVQIGTNKSVILRAGRLAQPIRACGDHWPQRSLLVIAAPYETSESARQLAIRWLDKGSADQVFIGLDWASHLKTWLGSSPSLNAQTQVVVILPTSTNTAQAADQLRDHPGPSAVAVSEHFATLARDLDFPGIRMIKGVSDNWQVVHTQGQVRVYGGPDRQPRSVTQLDEIQWVNICPGTFSMGSNKEADPMADSDEIVKPSRTAILSGFNMAATETTEHQYAKHFPVDGEPSQKPKAQVAWEEAQAFCNKVKGELPTEAQWEYAARGGSQFPWSFGNDEKKLEHYAWFGENAEEAQNVQMKGPNPLGLYDMHGNVWEWTQDWYGPYSSGVFVDPTGPSSSERRVLRGGSFGYSPEFLRSADRGGGRPEFRLPNDGFRCVRVSPQP